MRILMIRHGRTDWNAGRRIQGRTDVPLSAEGRLEQRGHTLPADFAGAPAFVSPLGRARRTAELLGLDRARIEPRLTEMDFGEWEGRTHAELRADDPAGLAALEARGLDMRPPGGETPREVGERLLGFLAELDTDRAILVTHKGVMRAALARAWGWDMTADPPEKIDWSAGQVLDFAAGALRPVTINLPLRR
ncbi:histidine phosphatase family protein [Minwuia thermotolerans]|uniref:Histidine phosphatase family protein n=1 Tax=Minwuia thermotolerans TaxID=2056226 RepID=A0A2M9G5S9_9PROT|nr:histidine phosphatase family protein [Minwuia thermotolerans]PJK31060.1 histidine phosphatase family protein [Minwuia thermotolerans]